MDYSQIAQAAAIGFVAAMSPGPDGLLVLRTALRFGRVAGLGSVAGIAAGNVAMAGAAVAMIGIVSQLGHTATVALQLTGAAYLAYMGVKLLRANQGTTSGAASAEGNHSRKFFTQGLLTNLLNPKAIIFYLALVPQLPGASGDRVWAAGLFVLGAVGWFLMLSQVAAGLSRLLRPTVHLLLDRVTGFIFVGLAVIGSGVALGSVLGA